MFLEIVLIISVTNGAVSAKNILFVSLVPSPSHHIWNEALVEGLLGKEHNVTMIGYYPPNIKSSRYSVIEIEVDPFVKSVDSVLKDLTASTSLRSILTMWTFIRKKCEYNFGSKQFQNLLAYPEGFFDLLIFDLTFSECYLPLIDHFGNPPSVGVTAFGLQSYMNDIVGERTESYIPYYAFPYTDRMAFFQRLRSVFFVTFERLSRWYYLRELNEMCKNVFGRSTRRIQELEQDVSLVFPNDDPVLDYPKPSSPQVIPIGGVHVKIPGKLDRDIQIILNESRGGVIFASLGSNFQPKHYADHVKKAFAKAFSGTNLTVLWRFDEVEVSKNVIVKSWFPQSDILAHPNTKLFITHCGALSSQETIIRGVPIVGIPLFHDQFYRSGKFTAVRGGVILDYWGLTPKNLYSSIAEVLTNPEYKENMVKLSKLYKEQPLKPLEKFLIWIEYVLQNGHLDHLSIAGRRMTWYQSDNWDIFGFVIILVIIAIVLLNQLYYRVIKRVCKSNDNRKQKLH